MNIYLLNFNNYYNRQVKIYSLLSGYLNFMSTSSAIGDQNPIQGVNFIPNDGVTAEQVINWNGQNPDYMIVADGNTIVSRWYIVESVRLRSGQYHLSLYRDLIADYYNEIVKAPMFIEKGYVGKNDPAIFNNENMTFNQIKKREYLLKDNTKSAWIVGYMEIGDGNPATFINVNYGGTPQASVFIPVLKDWEYYDLLETDQAWVLKDNTQYKLRIKDYEFINETVEVVFDANSNISVEYEDYEIEGDTGYYIEDDDDLSPLKSIIATTTLNTKAAAQFGRNTITSGQITALENLDGQIAKVGTNSYYRLHVNSSTGRGGFQAINSGTEAFIELRNIMSVFQQSSTIFAGTADAQSFQVSFESYIANIFMEPISLTEGLTTIIKGDRPTLSDAPYSMFCIPYSDEYKYKTADGTFTTSKANALSLATGIATSLGGLDGASKLYDIQLLPYCPIDLLRDQGTTIDLTNSEIANSLYYDINDDSQTIMFFASKSSGSFNITYNYYYRLDNLQTKINSQTQFWRLCSPNYNGVFEFNPWKNKGTAYINVDYTYKPFQPYIHLNPNFKGLYGGDFNDVRGLVCGGDFSLPVIENAWIDYQNANKNYNAIFNRQIESMEVNNMAQRKIEAVQAIAGTVSGTMSGAVSGGFVGGVPGLLIGGVAGGVTSYAAGEAQRNMNELLRNEAIDFTKDQFGYQLGNIQALPQALSRVSSFNENNKIFPFIEEYDATDEEKTALENKIKYNGMTIMRIGTLQEFLPYKPQRTGWTFGYFKGQLIRLEGIDDDSHIINAIASELNKGVYLI